jgi:hypothetical protein
VRFNRSAFALHRLDLLASAVFQLLAQLIVHVQRFASRPNPCRRGGRSSETNPDYLGRLRAL